MVSDYQIELLRGERIERCRSGEYLNNRVTHVLKHGDGIHKNKRVVINLR